MTIRSFPAKAAPYSCIWRSRATPRPRAALLSHAPISSPCFRRWNRRPASSSPWREKAHEPIGQFHPASRGAARLSRRGGAPGPGTRRLRAGARPWQRAHLRPSARALPQAQIYVFDRQVNAHPDCVPPADHLFLGEILETLPQALARLGAGAALVHTDVGTGDQAANTRLAASLAPLIRSLMRPGGVVISDQQLTSPGLTAMPLPQGVKPGRYFINRAV